MRRKRRRRRNRSSSIAELLAIAERALGERPVGGPAPPAALHWARKWAGSRRRRQPGGVG
eukprot:3594577-Pyramimonas_sp.AAC.1